MVISTVLVATFLLMCATTVRTLSYADLEILDATCPPKDTCVNSSLVQRMFMSTNCECDFECELYGDCCIDALQGAYVINKCSSSWNGYAEVRRKCERVNDISDPLMASPATDTEHNVTYKNMYCAECNNVNLTLLQSWSIGLQCDSLLEANHTGNIPWDYIDTSLFFKRTYPFRNTWGVYLWNESSYRMDFHPCKMSFVLPEDLTRNVRFCRPDVISTCSPTWRFHSVRSQCRDYMAVVYISGQAFKNPHCALCNGRDLNALSCTYGMLSRRRPPMSFTLLMDVNTKDGNRVGMIEENRCNYGEKWDPFFKKCRTVVCALPGYKMVNERCVPP